jgi:hypothetical protein
MNGMEKFPEANIYLKPFVFPCARDFKTEATLSQEKFVNFEIMRRL